MPFGWIKVGLFAFEPAKEVDAPAAFDNVSGQVQTSLAAGGVNDDVKVSGFEVLFEVFNIAFARIEHFADAGLLSEAEAEEETGSWVLERVPEKPSLEPAAAES